MSQRPPSVPMESLRRAACEAFWALSAADAMSMPAHWYYDVRHIRRDFGGWISGFHAPRETHPSSILALSNTAGGGRATRSAGGGRPDVVGNVILHDKLGLWRSSTGSVHYHRGLRSGDNTLNVLCALRAARTLAAGRFADPSRAEARAAVLADYVGFMTTPRTHADTYAESFHRSFFADWQDERPTSPSQVLMFAETRARRMSGSSHPDGQLDAIGCLTPALPFLLLSASANEERAVSAAVEFVKLTHPHPSVPAHVEVYGRALHAVLGGAGLRQQAEHALRKLKVWDVCQSYSRRAARLAASSEECLKVHQSAVNELGLACYAKGALCSLFYLAHEFHDDPRGGILTNTNCGGENCNRGAALGALLGAAGSYSGALIPQEWKDELRNAQEVLPGILKEMQ